MKGKPDCKKIHWRWSTIVHLHLDFDKAFRLSQKSRNLSEIKYLQTKLEETIDKAYEDIGLFLVPVDYDKSIEQMRQIVGLEVQDFFINSEAFPRIKKGKVTLKMRLVTLDIPDTISDSTKLLRASNLLAEMNLIPADIYEMFAFINKCSNLPKGIPIQAIGSILHRDALKDFLLPVINGRSGREKIDVNKPMYWEKDDLFLAVRKEDNQQEDEQKN